MKLEGTVPRGPYQGQVYRIANTWAWTRWYQVQLVDSEGHYAVREVREADLEES